MQTPDLVDYSAVIVNPKHATNRGSVERAVWNFGGGYIARRGQGKGRPCTDTHKAYRHLAYVELPEEPAQTLDWATNSGVTLVAVETEDRFSRIPKNVWPIDSWFSSALPPRTLYLLGNEANGLPNDWLEVCQAGVWLPMSRAGSANVAVVAGIVLQRHAEVVGKC